MPNSLVAVRSFQKMKVQGFQMNIKLQNAMMSFENEIKQTSRYFYFTDL